VDQLCVVVLDVLMKESAQVPLVEYDHVIQQLATNAPDPALRPPVLPRTSVSGSLVLDSEVLDRVEDTIREDRGQAKLAMRLRLRRGESSIHKRLAGTRPRVVVVDQESVGVLFGKRLPELLDLPGSPVVLGRETPDQGLQLQ
jgi:hypothetical protein